MYVQESGTHGAPTVVFLHGAGTGGWMWTPQVEAMQDYHCLVLDLPGHGKIDQTEWRSWRDSVERVAAIIDARATNGRAHIVGLSLGGYLGMGLIAHHSPLINRAVLSGITVAPFPNKAAMMFQIRVLSLFLKTRFVIDLNMRMLKMPTDARDAYADGMRVMSPQAFRKIGRETLDFHAPEELRVSPVPTLVVAGEYEMRPVHEALTRLPAIMPHAEARIAPEASHGWSGEKPELFTAMVRAWLTDSPLPAELIAAGKVQDSQPAAV